MSRAEGVSAIPGLSGDDRIQVFRRHFAAVGEFEGLDVDAYVILTERYSIVCDTMLCPADVAFMMEITQQDLAGRPLLVVNSHADWDHTWGNVYFTGKRAAPILAHTYGLTRMQSVETQAELAEFQQRYSIFQDVVVTPPTITFEQGLTIHGGDLTVELFSAPGHQPDHIAAWIPELRLLLAFDALENPIVCLNTPEGVPQTRATLERMLTLHPERVLCSHGKGSSPDLVKANLAYLLEMERRSRAALLNRRSGEEEMLHNSAFISYSFDEVIGGGSGEIDRTFYSQAHEENIHCMVQWLLHIPVSAAEKR
jgi:glyoxylase-like metal-dependent hydrolase (beta-lactamase superfamily II)